MGRVSSQKPKRAFKSQPDHQGKDALQDERTLIAISVRPSPITRPEILGPHQPIGGPAALENEELAA